MTSQHGTILNFWHYHYISTYAPTTSKLMLSEMMMNEQNQDEENQNYVTGEIQLSHI